MHHSGRPVVRQELGGICTFLRLTTTFRVRARAVTHQAPATHHPPTDQPTTHSSTAAVEQYVSTNPQRQHSSTAVSTTADTCGTPRTGWDLHFLTILHFLGESASRHRPSTHQTPRTHRPTHHHSSTIAVEQYVPTNPQRQHSTHYSGTPVVRQELGGICTFLRFSTFRGRARAVPGKGYSCPPLAELRLVGRCVAGETEG